MRLPRRAYGFPDILCMPLGCAPVLTALLILAQLLAGLVPTLEILYVARFLDIAGAVVHGQSEASAVLLPIALVVSATAYNWLSGQISGLIVARIRMKARNALRPAVAERRAGLEYRFIEDADAWDLMQRVGDEPEKQLVDGLNSLLNLAALILRVSGVMIVLFARVWWAALIILALSAPMIGVAVKSGKASYQAERDNTKTKRKYEYLSEVLMGRDSAPERTLFGYGGKFNEDYKKEFLSAFRFAFKVRAKWFGRRMVSGVVFALVAVMITLVLLPATLAGALSFGLFISLSNSVVGMVNIIAWSLGDCVDGIAKRREQLRDLTKFLELDEATDALADPGDPLEFSRLELKNVSFTYPGTDRKILDGLSLTVEKGGHYALVGINGAGKTTLTKLLTGLYGGYEGQILLNGKEIREYTSAQLKACFSLVYQDFSKYNISVRDNIAFELPGRGEKVAVALEAVGLAEAVARLPQGLDTPLGKIEGEGQDFSGGEWQRLAMARAIVNPASVRILDEPTAALDPIGESRVYHEFEAMSRGKTTIFISHRLGSTALADEIYVLGGGKVLESGSHDQLMAANGLYAQMYAAQRSWYE